MPRKRHRSTSPEIRFRNMHEASGLPAMAGRSRLGLKATKPITESVTITPPSEVVEAVFSRAGAVVVSESGPFRVRAARTLTAAAISLGTAGSTGTTIEVRRNGTAVAGGTITIASSDTTSTTVLSVTLVADDILTVAVTTAGTAAADLTVQLWF